MKSDTRDLLDLIKSYKEGSIVYDLKPFDSNHWFRRLFRLYIDGSHSYPGNEPGYKFTERLKSKVKEIQKSGNQATQYKKLVSIVIDNFLNMLQVEFNLSRSTLQKTLVKNFSKSDLDLINQKLVRDLLEYVNEE